MGNCVGAPKHFAIPKQALEQIRLIISNEEIYILHMIYKDLSERAVERKINLQNFLLFFHKNGFWGQRLFKEFDFDETNLISEEEFIRGIAKIFKSSEKEKISLLFKFFSKTGKGSEGVFFQEFLAMLYNYPKEDLKEILNDKEFIQFELKKRMVLIENKSKDDLDHHMYRLDSTASIKRGLKRQSSAVKRDSTSDIPFPSMVGKDIIKNIKDKYKTNETVVSFKDGDKVYDIRTSNIQQLVKRFALRIFHQAKIDVHEGKLNFYQFYGWISVHKTLYENYYEGFHNLIWEIDPLKKRPKYLLANCEKISEGKLVIEEKKTKVKMFLHHSILVICEEGREERPLQVICLDGLTVKRLYDEENGFGIEISHRDGIYTQKKIFLKNEILLFQWMELLKFYKGESVQQKYEIGKKIGTGKFSVVYRCKHNIENKEYALKEIATFKLEAQAKSLIAHESSIMQIVSHPLLLQFKECIQTKTHIYIVTELVNGKDLFEFVKDQESLDEYDAAKIIQQLIVGIRFLHSFEIVHRDLKPQNIMVVIDDDSQEISNIKIIDFGFSNYLTKLQNQPTVELLAGTPNFIAPQILKEVPFGFKIDNFAIGVILFFMLTGSLPFNDDSITDILQNTIKGEYKFSDRRILSDEAIDLTDQLLKNDPEERISLQNALKHPWFRILKSQRKSVRSPGKHRRNHKLID